MGCFFFSFLIATGNVTIGERALSRCGKELDTVTAGRRGHLHIVSDKLMVKLALTLFLFYPESLVVSFGA